MSTIVRLEAENVKRLHAVRITANGEPIVTVGGNNGQGKTSVLDAIMYAIGGKDVCCSQPIRNGEDKASSEVEISCDDGTTLIVRRTWKRTASGNVTTAVAISQKTEFGEAKLQSPQAILDSLCGKMAFDPMEFSRLKPKDQLETLKELVGVSTDEIDASIDAKFRDRTDVNRRVKELEGQVAGAVTHADAPAEEVSVSRLMEELKRAQRTNQAADSLRRDADAAWKSADGLADQIAALRLQLETLTERHQAAATAAEVAEKAASECVRVDAGPIETELANAETVNRKVRENAAAKSLADRLEAAKSDAANLSKSIDTLRVDRQLLLESAKWPVPGLGFGDGVVLFNGLPLDQACQSEKIKVGMAIAIAMNPKLRVVLMREASLLDDNSMQVVEDFCREHQAQAWLECVGTDDDYSVIIEDGEVRAREPAECESQELAVV